MSISIETGEIPCDALGAATRVLVAQAYALDSMFYRAAREAFSTESSSYYHARKALKAQDKCRATFNLLVKLRAAAGATEKFPNFDGGSIQTLKTIIPTNGLLSPENPVGLDPARRPKPRALRSNRWTPERRARQAASIRAWQSWRKSTGPQTPDGKARSARNALKHGLRSKATLEARREDRRILASASDNLAILRIALAAAKTERQTPPLPRRPALFHSIDIGPTTLTLIPSGPTNDRGIAAWRHPPPVRPRAPRRRWRIAS